ncbi:DUF1690-domain-containing protein [Daldinia caldariorum]|uniref:DUF1690-domain-containing protein n=1 Tax=Daldinia caldariorum TaxID=326644 RepID=UPI002008525C|nr:DUF1690-domain-containing protein [Daldinia caldariorum]KAI1472581.1 DUF1690-domain-containing protein [Daldinia caldariorum]
MGSSSSKPEASQSSYIWKASSPVGVSHDVLETLQSSSETDTTRAQTLELVVQARVADELKKLEAQETAALKEALDKVAESSVDDDNNKQLSTPAVSKEIEALRARLEKRKQLRPLPDTVEQARGSVVRCLLENDRRPLDCWREVEAFKEEVRKLEKEWVDKVVS